MFRRASPEIVDGATPWPQMTSTLPLFSLHRMRGDIAARTILVGLDHVQDTAGRHRRIEGIAAPFQHGHAGGTGLPVCGGHHAEGSDKFRA